MLRSRAFLRTPRKSAAACLFVAACAGACQRILALLNVGGLAGAVGLVGGRSGTDFLVATGVDFFAGGSGVLSKSRLAAYSARSRFFAMHFTVPRRVTP